MSEQNQPFDVVVLGGGPGGYVAAIRAAQLKMKTALIEQDRVGGVCLNWGCIPSKALLRSAEVYSLCKRGKEFGLHCDHLQVDFHRVVQRSRQVADRLVKGVEFLLKKNDVTLFTGTGRFVAPGEIGVFDPDGNPTDRISFKQAIIATGARPRSIPGLEIDRKKILTSTEAMVLENVPTSMIIVGTGAIGVEFAYLYSTFGTKVTLIEMMPRILPLEDKEVAEVVAKQFTKANIEILTNTRVEASEMTDEGVIVRAFTPDGPVERKGEIALVAVGVQGNSDGIGLEALGIEVEESFVVVDKRTYRANIEGIYAVGDVIGPPLLAHVASAEGIAAVEGIAGLREEGVDYSVLPNCIYCQPQVASVGLTEKQALEAGHGIKVGRFPFRANGKSLALGEREGFVKLIFDATYGELLGAHIVGSEAAEMIGELCTAKALETTYLELLRTIHAHPTLSEAIMEAAGEAFGGAIHI